MLGVGRGIRPGARYSGACQGNNEGQPKHNRSRWRVRRSAEQCEQRPDDEQVGTGEALELCKVLVVECDYEYAASRW